jgi:hypothetical protein
MKAEGKKGHNRGVEKDHPPQPRDFHKAPSALENTVIEVF